MQQKNCFFCSFAHKTSILDDIDVFFNNLRTNIKQKSFIEKEYQNVFADHFLQIFRVTLIFSFKNEEWPPKIVVELEHFFYIFVFLIKKLTKIIKNSTPVITQSI